MPEPKLKLLPSFSLFGKNKPVITEKKDDPKKGESFFSKYIQKQAESFKKTGTITSPELSTKIPKTNILLTGSGPSATITTGEGFSFNPSYGLRASGDFSLGEDILNVEGKKIGKPTRLAFQGGFSREGGGSSYGFEGSGSHKFLDVEGKKTGGLTFQGGFSREGDISSYGFEGGGSYKGFSLGGGISGVGGTTDFNIRGAYSGQLGKTGVDVSGAYDKEIKNVRLGLERGPFNISAKYMTDPNLSKLGLDLSTKIKTSTNPYSTLKDVSVKLGYESTMGLQTVLPSGKVGTTDVNSFKVGVGTNVMGWDLSAGYSQQMGGPGALKFGISRKF